MVDVTKLTLPKGGSVTAPPKPKEPAVYVEPWKPWGQGFAAWYDWMCSAKSAQTLVWNMKSVEAIQLYNIMNDVVYEIKRKNEEVQL